MQIDSGIELYDSDKLKIQAVIQKLRARVGTRMDKSAFLREVAERFAEAGYLVDIKVTTTEDNDGDQTFHPEITISSRVEEEQAYDYDRQRHEVQSNVLGVAGQDAKAAPVAMPGAGKLWTPGSPR